MLAISMSEQEFMFLRKKDLNEKWIAIRIYSQPEEVKYMTKRFNQQFEDTLHVYFTDIPDAVEQDGKWYRPFSDENLQAIIAFIQKYEKADKVFVHCHAGVCRSPGVVVGLANLFPHIVAQHGLDGQTGVFPYPNVVSHFEK